MQLTVPGTSSAGRVRFVPWWAKYAIRPAKPAASQSRNRDSSAPRSIAAIPVAAKPSSALQRLIAATSSVRSAVVGDSTFV